MSDEVAAAPAAQFNTAAESVNEACGFEELNWGVFFEEW